MDFTGKKVFITGATKGIGKSIAEVFFNNGAEVSITGRDEVSNLGLYFHHYFTADFTKKSDIDNCALFLQKQKPDVLINNAGTNKISKFVEILTEDFLTIQQVNLFAPFILCQAAIPNMKKNNWGRIVNISSIWGKIGKEYRAAYSASKFGLDGLTIALAIEHASDGIIANSIAPGFTDTDMTRKILGEQEIDMLSKTIPIKRMAKTEEIAEIVLWLCSNRNTYITGQNISIDGGFHRS